MESAAWGLIGTIVGALTSIATTWLSGKTSSRLQDEKARAERAARASTLQRESLLELQEAIHDALRLIYRAHIEDCQSVRSGTEWASATLSEEVSEGVRLAQRRIAILVERLTDEPLRKTIKALMDNASRAMLASTVSESRDIFERTTVSATQVLESIGEELRRHY